jgi:hypothetical protein
LPYQVEKLQILPKLAQKTQNSKQNCSKSQTNMKNGQQGLK